MRRHARFPSPEHAVQHLDDLGDFLEPEQTSDDWCSSPETTGLGNLDVTCKSRNQLDGSSKEKDNLLKFKEKLELDIKRYLKKIDSLKRELQLQQCINNASNERISMLEEENQ